MEKNTEKQGITMKTGVVDVGGGLRGIYAVWVPDDCMEHKIYDLSEVNQALAKVAGGDSKGKTILKIS